MLTEGRIALCLCLLIAVGLTACNKKNDKPAAGEERTGNADPEKGHRTGLANASAMVENAERCEPKEGVGVVGSCQRACELNHSNSCANWGRFLEDSDKDRAIELYQRSCIGGSGIGCEAEARAALQADESEAAELFVDARNYHRVHCAQGYARSCSQLAVLLEQGLGGKVSKSTAQSFRERACLLGYRSDC